MMSGAAVGSKSTADRALQQQIQTVWKTLQDTRSNLFVCDTLVRQIVKPAPAVTATVTRQTNNNSMQTDIRPVTSVGTQCACATVENECCQTAPELCTQGVQTEDFTAAVRNECCQAVANFTTSAVQTSEAGVRFVLVALPLFIDVHKLVPDFDVTGTNADAEEPEDLPLVHRSTNSAVPRREYQRLKRKTEVLKRRLRAERTKNARVLSGDSAYRVSALRLATLALSIQETYQEMLLDLGSLLQQLAALVSDAPIPVTLPLPDGVGGWYRQVRELAVATLRSIIGKQMETGQARSEVPNRESSPAGNIRCDRDLVPLVTPEDHRVQIQSTLCIHSDGSQDPGRGESYHSFVEAKRRSTGSADTGDDPSTGVYGRHSPQVSIEPQTLICSSRKSTPRENVTESDSSFPYRLKSINVQTEGHAVQVRKCSQSHQMCDSDLGPCLKSNGHRDENRQHGGGDSTSDEESAVDIACCSHTCHHHTYLKTFIESQKKSQVRKETAGSFCVKKITLNNSGCSESETNGGNVRTVAPDAPEGFCPSCALPASSAQAYSGYKKMRRDSRSRNIVPVGADVEQKPADDSTQYKNLKKCVRSEEYTSSEKLYVPINRSQTEHTVQQSGRWHALHRLSGSGGQTVKNGSAKSFCSAPSLGTKELPKHLQGQVELLEKCLTSSDFTETISSSITASRTSHNSASSSSVPKTKLRSRRAIRPITSSTTDTQQSSRSLKGEHVSQEKGTEQSESAFDESATLTPRSGSLSAQQSVHLRFVEILDELKEKLLQCDE